MAGKQKHNPHRLPFSPTLSLEHRKATTPSLPSSSPKLCACCLLPVDCVPLPINFSMEEVGHLGAQYPGFYAWVKIVALVLACVVFDSGVSQLQDIVVRGAGDGAGQGGPRGIFGVQWTALTSGYPKEKFWLYSSLSFVSLGFFMLGVRVYQKYKASTAQPTSVGQQKWSILLKNLPKSLNAQQKIHDLFKTNFNSIQIRQIMLLPTMTKYNELKQQIQKEVDTWRELLKNQDKKKEEILESLKNIERCRKEVEVLKGQMVEKRNEYFSGNAIVTFETMEQREEVLKAWKLKFFTKNKVQASFGEVIFGDRQVILIEQAPSPSEIEWSNICLPHAEAKAKTKFNYLLVFIVQVVGFLVYFLSQLAIGRKVGEPYQETKGTAATLVFISILSYALLPWVLQLLQKRQKSPSMTQYYTSLTYKLIFSQVLLRSLIILAAESVFTSGSELAQCTLHKVIILSVADFFVVNLLSLINFPDLLKRAQIRFLHSNKHSLTQQEANSLYQRPSHSVAQKYSHLLTVFLISIFFSNLAPTVLIVYLFSLLPFYWIDKLNFARRSSVGLGERGMGMGSKIGEGFYGGGVVGLLELGLVGKPVINLMLWSIAHQSKNIAIQEIVMLILGIAYNVAPKQKLIGKILALLKVQPKQNTNSVASEYNPTKFPTLYTLQSPIYGSLHQKQYFLQKNKGFRAIINTEGSKLSSAPANIGMGLGKNDFSDTIQDRIERSGRNAVEDQGVGKGRQDRIDEEREDEDEGEKQQGQQNTERNMVNCQQ